MRKKKKKNEKKGAGRKILPFHYQKWPKSKIRFENAQKQTAMLKRFHLNGHTTEIHPRTQKLVSTYKTPSLTFRVKI